MQKYRNFWAAAMLLVAGALLVLSQQEATDVQAQGSSIAKFRSFGDISTTGERPYADVVIGMVNDLDGDSTNDTQISLAPDVDGDGMSDIVTWRRKTQEHPDDALWRGEWIVTLSSSRYDAYLSGATISNRSGFGNVWVGGNGRYAQPYLKIYDDNYCRIPDPGSDTGNIVPLVGDVSFYNSATSTYDADGQADLGCVDRSQRKLFFLRSDKNYAKNDYASFVLPTGVPVSEGVLFYLADVDGDLKDDFIAVETDSPNNKMIFYLVRTRASHTYGIYTSTRDKFEITQVGTPFFGDLDGDGKKDFGVAKFDTSNGVYKYRLTNAIGGHDPTNLPGKFNDNAPGTTGDDGTPTAFTIAMTDTVALLAVEATETGYPVVADYDGDFVADLAVVRVASAGIIWRFRSSQDGGFGTIASLSHSPANPKNPVPGYWDADARADVMYVVNEAVGSPSTNSWNWYGGFSAGSRINNYIMYDNNVFPSERWGGAMANWQDVQPGGTVYPAIPVGSSPTVANASTATPTPWSTANWGLRCYKPEAPAANGTPSGAMGQPPTTPAPVPDTSLNEINCEQGYQITPTPNSNPSGTPATNLTPVTAGGFESQQIYRIDELAQTFNATNMGEGIEQRYYFNRRSFTNAWANYLDPMARMRLVLYKSAFVFESSDVATPAPDTAGTVTDQDRNRQDGFYGAWY